MRRLSRIRAPFEHSLISNSKPSFHCLSCRIQAPIATFSTCISMRAERTEKQAAGVKDEVLVQADDLKTLPTPALFGALAKAQPDNDGEAASFTPAASWEGLKWAGTPEWIQAYRTAKANIRVTMYCNTKGLSSPLTKRETIKEEVMRSLIEVLLFKESSVPLNSLHSRSPTYPFPKNVFLDVDPDTRAPKVQYPDELSKNYHRVVLGLSKVEGEKPSREEIAEACKGVELAPASSPETEAWQDTRADSTWKHVSLSDPEFKFALYKRIVLRTRIYVADTTLSRSHTLHALSEHLCATQIPDKLAQRLVLEDKLPSLPNVTLSPRRVGLIDREKALGRWKVIEQELLDRGLPVTGYRL